MKKQLLEIAGSILGICLVTSFIFSGIRAMGHDECSWEYQDPQKKELGLHKVCPDTPCNPLFVDKIEPFISTRWFCEMKK